MLSKRKQSKSMSGVYSISSKNSDDTSDSSHSSNSDTTRRVESRMQKILNYEKKVWLEVATKLLPDELNLSKLSKVALIEKIKKSASELQINALLNSIYAAQSDKKLKKGMKHKDCTGIIDGISRRSIPKKYAIYVDQACYDARHLQASFNNDIQSKRPFKMPFTNRILDMSVEEDRDIVHLVGRFAPKERNAQNSEDKESEELDSKVHKVIEFQPFEIEWNREYSKRLIAHTKTDKNAYIEPLYAAAMDISDDNKRRLTPEIREFFLKMDLSKLRDIDKDKLIDIFLVHGKLAMFEMFLNMLNVSRNEYTIDKYVDFDSKEYKNILIKILDLAIKAPIEKMADILIYIDVVLRASIGTTTMIRRDIKKHSLLMYLNDYIRILNYKSPLILENFNIVKENKFSIISKKNKDDILKILNYLKKLYLVGLDGLVQKTRHLFK